MFSFSKNLKNILIAASVACIIMLSYVVDRFFPGTLTDLPHYDLVYMVGGYYTYSDPTGSEKHFGLNIGIKNNKIYLYYRGNCYYTVPTVYIFRASTRHSSEVSITPFNNYNDLRSFDDAMCQGAPNNRDDINKVTLVDVPELNTLFASPGLDAPDGYRFINQQDQPPDQGFIYNFFFGSAKKNSNLAWVKKGIYKIRLPYTGIEYDYYSKAQFISWIVPKPEIKK